MPNLHLHGNHQPCPTCKGTGHGAIVLHANEYETDAGHSFPKENHYANCPGCAGYGRVAMLTPAIMAAQAERCPCCGADDMCQNVVFEKPDQRAVVV